VIRGKAKVSARQTKDLGPSTYGKQPSLCRILTFEEEESGDKSVWTSVRPRESEGSHENDALVTTEGGER
jgi:hypothetical protein